jgi:hypothetical protein
MKKLKLLLPALLLSLLANSQPGQLQQIKIVSFTVKNQLPASIDNWLSIPGALIMVAQKVPNPRMVEPRLVVQIRSGGAVLCGNNAATARQVDPFDVRTFNTADLTGFLTNCHELKEGSYTICVQFFNIDKIAISQEVCKEFRVEATKTIEYAPPTLITPEDGKKFSATQLLGPVMFRWTPVVPKPSAPVTYRLKVWQLMEGQNGTTAIRMNTPIFTKDVENLTQVPANGIYNGPCKPPYLCDFVWNVQAVTRDGKPIGSNNGTSEPYTFGVTKKDNKCPANIFPEDKKKFNIREAKDAITFKWTDATPGGSTTYLLKVWQLMEGQSGAQAMRSNKALITREIKNATEATVTGIYNGPCKPPYLCDFIWTVETMPVAGQTGCSSNATSFSIANNDIDIQIDSVYTSCCNSNGTQNIYIKIKNNLGNTVKITNLNIDKVNGVTNVITITGLSPALPVNIPGFGSQAFTGTIKCVDTARTLRFYVRAEDAADNAITESEVETDTLNCPCDPCRSMGVSVTGDKLTTVSNSSNEVTLSGVLSGLDPNKVKKVTIELVYFNITQTGDSNCAKCAENKEWGNFIPPANQSLGGFSNPVLNGGNFGREWTWISTMDKACGDAGNGGGVGHDNGKAIGCATCGTVSNPINNNNNNETANGVPVIIDPGGGIPKANSFSLPIAVPPGPSLSCCGDKIKICIRYTWWDFCCHACDVIRCYELERKPK